MDKCDEWTWTEWINVMNVNCTEIKFKYLNDH